MSLHPDIAAVLNGDSEGCIVTGDCLEIMADMPDGCVDAVVTDPPYSTGGAYRADRNQPTDKKYQHTHETTRTYGTFSGDNRDQRSYERWCRMWMADCLHLAHAGSVFATFIDWRNLACMIDAVQVAGWVFRGVVPWHKGLDQRPRKGWFRANVEYLVMGSAGPLLTGHLAPGICADGVIYCRVNGAEKQHQTGKPVGVCEMLLKARPNADIILDPFCGSGTTCVAAKKLGRRWIGIEIDEKYAEIARNRVRSTPRPLFTEADKSKPKAAKPALFAEATA